MTKLEWEPHPEDDSICAGDGCFDALIEPITDLDGAGSAHLTITIDAPSVEAAKRWAQLAFDAFNADWTEQIDKALKQGTEDRLAAEDYLRGSQKGRFA